MMMNEGQMQDFRLAVLADLAQAVPDGMGRTALMKCVFFLQEVRGVPLGYRFGLYTYGPYDASVLEDVKLAQARGILLSKVVEYSNGYGYAIRPGDAAADVQARASEQLAEHQAALKWVREEFAHRSASELEMASTLVFVDFVSSHKTVWFPA